MCDCNTFVVFLAVLIALLVAAVMIVSLFNSSDAAATTHFSVLASGDEVRPGPGDPDGTTTGVVEMNRNTGVVKWNLLYENLDQVTAVAIYGPLTATNVDVAPVAIALCGAPSPDACPAGLPLEGMLDELWTGDAPNPVITDIQCAATFYYIQIDTVGFPTGAVRASMGHAF